MIASWLLLVLFVVVAVAAVHGNRVLVSSWLGQQMERRQARMAVVAAGT